MGRLFRVKALYVIVYKASPWTPPVTRSGMAV